MTERAASDPSLGTFASVRRATDGGRLAQQDHESTGSGDRWSSIERWERVKVKKSVALVAGLLLILGIATASGASPLAETTVHVGDKGGRIFVAVKVGSANRCVWSSDPKIAGFNDSVKCKAGKVSRSAVISANATTHARTWQLTLVVRGAAATGDFHWMVIESGKIIIEPGAAFGCTGSAPNGISITYGDEGSNYSGKSLPFSASMPLYSGTDYYDISAQLQGGGSVKCHLTVIWRDSAGLHSVSQRGSAAGSYNIASAEVCNETELGDGWQAC